MFYCMFYFTCDRSFTRRVYATSQSEDVAGRYTDTNAKTLKLEASDGANGTVSQYERTIIL